MTIPATNMIAPGVYHAKPLRETWVELAHSDENRDKAAECSIAVQITDDGPYKGRDYIWYGSFHEKATDITMRTLGELGIVFDAETGTPNLAGLVDEVRVSIVHRQQRQYNKETGALEDVFNDDGTPKVIPQINYITKGTPMARAEEDASKISAHRERMRALAAKVTGPKGPARTAEGLPKGPDGKPLF